MLNWKPKQHVIIITRPCLWTQRHYDNTYNAITYCDLIYNANTYNNKLLVTLLIMTLLITDFTYN